MINIQVVYATPDNQTLISLVVEESYTALQAAQLSNLAEQHSEIDLSQATLGIFSQIVSADTILKEGDRVEVYRPLIIDPKESRRQRAEQARLKQRQQTK